MLTLRDLQAEHAVWAQQNYPDETELGAFLGLVEELGELARAEGKVRQKFRGISAGAAHDQRIDGIGDLVIYLAGYCTRNGIDLQDAVEMTWDQVKQRRSPDAVEEQETYDRFCGERIPHFEHEYEHEGRRHLCQGWGS